MRRRTRGDVRWHERSEEGTRAGGQGGGGEEKNWNQHNSFPLISSVYNIKTIKGCFCQRILNNTLVRAKKEGGG